MAELESRLADLALALEWPVTPDLRAGVSAGLEGSRRRRRLWPLALAAALLAAMLGAGLLITPVRETVAGWLGLSHVEIHRVQRVPTPAASPAGAGSAVGQAEAGRLAGFAVRLPAALGSPREIDFDPRSREVTAVYADALVTEAAGTFPVAFVQKMVGPGTRFEQVTVNGRPGVWLEGEPHAVFYLDRNGQFVNGSLRLAGNTLVWEEGGVVYRIEANVTRERALEVAGTVR